MRCRPGCTMKCTRRWRRAASAHLFIILFCLVKGGRSVRAVADYDRWVWAKWEPFCSLSQHMIAVGACAEVYLSAQSSLGLRERLSKWLGLDERDGLKAIAYLFSLHDIGKAHAHFQYRKPVVFEGLRDLGYRDILPNGDMRFRHERYGADQLRALWRKQAFRFPGKAGDLFAGVIGLHHQGKIVPESPGTPEMWKRIQSDLERRMRGLFDADVAEPTVRNADALGILLTALLILCDWVASSFEFGVFDGDDDCACRTWALERAGKTLRSFGLISDADRAFPDDSDFCAFWPQIPRNGMRPLQRACETLHRQPSMLTIIEAPPGEGKTEAALYLAGGLCARMNLHGIYMALPTAATSNQMVGRVSTLLAEHGMGRARLLHGSAWMLDERSAPAEALSLEDDAAAAADWLRPLRRGLLSENAVGTVDQAMSAVLLIKYGMLRLAGLAEKVLIIDEIHAYDAYMSEIIARLLDWCRALQIPVILLSATLQRTQKEKYLRCYTADVSAASDPAYPLMTCVGTGGDVSCHAVAGTYIHARFVFIPDRRLGDIAAMAELARERTRHGGCLCVMLNTVARAQAVYLELKKRGQTDVMLFHARFRMRRRGEIERECLRVFGRGQERPERMILVCTQVVEQSLDVDFDGMITEIAPMDLLIQRAGRVHRHAGVRRPKGLERREIIVFTPGDDADVDLEARYLPFGTIYAPCVLNNTEAWLGQGRGLRVPEDVRACIEAVYSAFDEAAMTAYIQKRAQDDAAEIAAQGCIYDRPSSDRFFGRIRSRAQAFCMEDSEDPGDRMRRGGARTRNGQDSACVAFLPKDFEWPEGDEKRQAEAVLRESVNLRLTNELYESTIKIVDEKNRYLRHCTVLKPQEDGDYILGGQRWLADDELGVRRG